MLHEARSGYMLGALHAFSPAWKASKPIRWAEVKQAAY
jgi:hypothetical protein